MSRKALKKNRSVLSLTVAILCVLLSNSFARASQTELSQVAQGIHDHAAQWVAGETSISQLPQDHRLKRLGLIKRAVSLPEGGLPAVSSPLVGVPATLDYRDYLNGTIYVNYVSPVRNQGSCGSCWAFATTAALESQMLMGNTSISPNEAEQILVSCSGAGSCSGGYIDKASNFIQTTGLPPEADFPYTGTNSSCSSAALPTWQSDTNHISNWRWVATTSPTVDAIKTALVNYGPLVTTMNVYSDFYYYTGGVYSYTSGTYQGGHAIEIVGYDDGSQSFIVKNSWGTGWGEAGFFNIAYSQLTNAVSFGDYTISYGSSNNIVSQCSYTLSPTSSSFKAAGGKGTASVSSQTSCNWTAVSHSTWITLTSGASGSSNGSVGYTVSPNTTGRNRNGSLTIGGQTFSVSQNRR